MSNTCENVRDELSALIDGELEESRRVEIEDHLAGCDDCRALRDELIEAKNALSELFEAELAAAPPAPAPEAFAAKTGAARPVSLWARSPLLKAGTAVAAAVLLMIGAFYVLPKDEVEAAPAALLKRAAERFQELRDVELWMRMESRGIAALQEMFGSKDKPIKRELARMRLLAKPEVGVLVREVEDFDDPSRDKAVSGVDMNYAWEYDEEEGVVELQPVPEGGLGSLMLGDIAKIDAKSADALALSHLSWSFLEQLKEKNRDFEIEEITGPFERRVKRRVFLLTQKSKSESEAAWSTSKI